MLMPFLLRLYCILLRNMNIKTALIPPTLNRSENNISSSHRHHAVSPVYIEFCGAHHFGTCDVNLSFCTIHRLTAKCKYWSPYRGTSRTVLYSVDLNTRCPSQWSRGLHSLERCDLGFESHSWHGCLYCVRLFCVCVVLLVGRGLARG
jgi:hypothetical protein